MQKFLPVFKSMSADDRSVCLATLHQLLKECSTAEEGRRVAGAEVQEQLGKRRLRQR